MQGWSSCFSPPVLWSVVILSLAVVVLAALYYRASWKWRGRVAVSEARREKVEAEERRMFDFLHGIGRALSVDSRAEDLHRYIVSGALRITEADGGAIYLSDRKGAGLRRAFGTDEWTAIFPVPPEAEKSKELLATYLRWHAVPLGEGIIGMDWRGRDGAQLDGDDSRLPAGRCGSLMIAPLTFGGHQLGVLFVTRKPERESFAPGAFTIFESIAEQSAFALHSSAIFHEAAEKKRMDEDLAVAHEIQRILLPTSAPDVAGFQISGINVPARQVSGDYYDYIEIDPEHLGLAIADVSGKGVAASLIMAMCRSVLRTQAQAKLSPAAALRAVNGQLYPDIKEDMFISMAYAVLHAPTSTLTLCRAGHDAPLLYRAKDQSVSRINPPGMALGIDGGGVFDRVTNDFTLTLEAGDVLLLYTDGVTEALNAQGDEFGMEKTIEALKTTAADGAAGLIARLTDDLRAFIGSYPQHDDITLIAIRKK